MTMTTLAARAPPVPAVVRLDHVLLRRVFLVLGLALVFVAPFTPDPVEFAVGALVPWLVLRIVGTPTLPAAVVFYLLWQWLQVFARTLVGLTDGEEMGRGVFGPWVVDAYWYMLASIVTLALAMRAVLGNTRPPTPRQATAHLASFTRGTAASLRGGPGRGARPMGVRQRCLSACPMGAR